MWCPELCSYYWSNQYFVQKQHWWSDSYTQCLSRQRQAYQMSLSLPYPPALPLGFAAQGFSVHLCCQSPYYIHPKRIWFPGCITSYLSGLNSICHYSVWNLKKGNNCLYQWMLGSGKLRRWRRHEGSLWGKQVSTLDKWRVCYNIFVQKYSGNNLIYMTFLNSFFVQICS